MTDIVDVSRIRALNNALRRSLAGGVLRMTAGVIALGRAKQIAILDAVAALDGVTGLAFAQGRCKFEAEIDALLVEAGAQLSERMRILVGEIRGEWVSLDRRITALDREFVERARADEAARRLVSIPGVGPMTATALRAAVDDGSAFARARDLPAWLGLVPRQHTTGGKPKLLGISKRGNAYLRGLFIHGARAALASLSKAEDATGRWLRGLLTRAHYNVVVIALAAKLA